MSPIDLPAAFRRLQYLFWLLSLMSAGTTSALAQLGGDNGWPSVLQVGSLTLQRCSAAGAYCGRLPRPLDPAGEVAGRIPVRFEFYPHASRAAAPAGTIVAVEGGPGFSTTAQASHFLALFGTLLDNRNLLLMDLRGTGRSRAIDCRPLQRAAVPTPSLIARCGRQLGNTADLYDSAIAAADLAALLDALGTGPVDLYGAGYGAYFAQTFAGLYPDRLRTLSLDSAYPVIGDNPWLPFYVPAARRALDWVCQRSSTCNVLPGTSMDRLVRLLDALRTHPFRGVGRDGDGRRRRVEANASALAYVMLANSPGENVARELDAAARAYLESQDPQPLLRLIAENQTSADLRGVPATYFSRGLFTAVSCSDYPQLYDMRGPPSLRLQQRDAAIAQREATDPTLYAPFTIAEFRGMPLDYSSLDLCVEWPAPSAAHPPGPPLPEGARFPAVPTLVLSGELDSLSAPEEGALTAALFPNARQVLVTNEFHITALGDRNDCSSRLIRNLIQSLESGDTACAARIPEVRTPPGFFRNLSDTPPAMAAEGNQGTRLDLQAAAAAVWTAGDVITRWWTNFTGRGAGLRGGRFDYRLGPGGHGYRFRLRQVRWVNDLAVTGTLDWAYGVGISRAHLRIKAAKGEAGILNIQWPEREAQAMAVINGTIGGRQIRAITPAP
jgi:pimeloyl-ACP methyl ester carboxylesterase